MTRRKSRSIEPMDVVVTKPQLKPQSQEDGRKDDTQDVRELGKAQLRPHLDSDLDGSSSASQPLRRQGEGEGEDETWRRGRGLSERRSVGSWGLAGGYEPANTEPRTGLHDDRADFGAQASGGDLGGGSTRVVIVGKAPPRGPAAPTYDDFGPGFGLTEHRPQAEAVAGGGRTIMVRRSGGSRA